MKEPLSRHTVGSKLMEHESTGRKTGLEGPIFHWNRDDWRKGKAFGTIFVPSQIKSSWQAFLIISRQSEAFKEDKQQDWMN